MRTVLKGTITFCAKLRKTPFPLVLTDLAAISAREQRMNFRTFENTRGVSGKSHFKQVAAKGRLRY